jgi:Zn-dependent M32 family carboxypeptidase
MHIILRYEIERGLISETIQVRTEMENLEARSQVVVGLFLKVCVPKTPACIDVNA